MRFLYNQYVDRGGRRETEAAVRDAPEDSAIEIKGLPLRGDRSAKVILVEFSDYECPFCQRHAGGAGMEIEKKFVAQGRVQHVFVNNPLPIHPNAKLLATAAICAGAQWRYWEMHDAIFSKNAKTREDVLAIAKEISVDLKKMTDCVDHSEEPAKRIAADMETAQKFNLNGTPMFAVGVLESEGRVKIQKFITGAQPIDVFEKTLNDLLRKADPS
jgi:protein-disulfide isomerase